ncbi:MAG TPA: hypothetical protein ENO24_05860 [Chloroflexi bacterium]|nr:hypothetical protein [Chloroflexota bacterium]
MTTLASPTPSPLVPAPTVPNWPVVLADDFDDAESGFDGSSSDQGQLSYQGSQYIIGVVPENQVVWSTRSGYVTDFAVEVAVESDGGVGFGGIIFRNQGEGQGGPRAYVFAVTPGGEYSLMKLGQAAEMILGWRGSNHVRTGADTNRLRVVCVGATLTLYVNGQYLDSVRDVTFVEGEVGMIAGTRVGDTHALFRFDNLRVYADSPLVPPTPTATSPAAPTSTRVPAVPTPTRGPIEFDPIIFAERLTPELDPDPPRTSFSYGVNRVYAVWACRGMYPGLEIVHTWCLEGGACQSGTLIRKEADERGREYVILNGPDGGPLPRGNYRLELYVGAQLLQSESFTIQ